MNEQIREIAEQVAKESELYCADKFDLNKDTNQFFVTVFAELIVKECIEVAYKAYFANPTTVRGRQIEEKVRQHFGVEK